MIIKPNSTSLTSVQQTDASQTNNKKNINQNHQVKDMTEFSNTLNKIQSGKYVPPHILSKWSNELATAGFDVGSLSGKSALTKAMQTGNSCFAAAKPANVDNLGGIRPREQKQAFPKSCLTRMLSGDVKPEWIIGLGRMQTDKVTPMEGYKDVFASSMEEYEKKGINFNPSSANDPAAMAEKLDLKPDDVDKIKKDGAWLIQIHPGSKLAIPTERKNEWNPGYVEGGYTGSNQQEWVTPNIGLDAAVRAGDAKIFKMDSSGKTEEWKFFQGKLMPADERQNAIRNHVESLAKKSLPQAVAPSA